MRVLVVSALLLVSNAAFAEQHKARDFYWRDCMEDSECMLIDGTCDKTAINKLYEPEARQYYSKMARSASCPQKFWVPKEVIAECKPLASSKPRETAEAEPHRVCAAVPKPVK